MVDYPETTPDRGPWIETFSGKKFHPLDPRPEDIDILDISHSLSLLCRFGGQCREFYSVAEHSVRVARYLMDNPPEILDRHDLAKLFMRALLHDASEAYVADVTRPVKAVIPQYKTIEKRIADVIYDSFGCFIPESEVQTLTQINDAVAAADNKLLATEASSLGMNKRGDWYLPEAALDEIIVPLTPNNAKAVFLDAFYKVRELLDKPACVACNGSGSVSRQTRTYIAATNQSISYKVDLACEHCGGRGYGVDAGIKGRRPVAVSGKTIHE